MEDITKFLNENLIKESKSIEYDINTELEYDKKYNDSLKQLTKGDTEKITLPIRIKSALKVYDNKIFTNSGVEYTLTVNKNAKKDSDILEIVAKKGSQQQTKTINPNMVSWIIG